MVELKCPVCGYQANTMEELTEHGNQMIDDEHKEALKQKMGEKGGEASDAEKDKTNDAASGIKN